MESVTTTTESQEIKVEKVSIFKNKKLLIILAIAAALLLCLCSLAGIFLLNRQNTPTQANKCMYNGREVEGSFASDDGCNTCSCGSDGLAVCTLKACVSTPVAPTPTPTPAPAPQPATPTSTIPSGFTLKTSTECAVKVPVPPQTAPYTETNGAATYKWLYSEVDNSYSLLFPIKNLIVRQTGYYSDTGDIIGTDNPARTFSVQCGTNNSYNYDTLISAYQEKLNEQAIEGLGEFTVTKNGPSIAKWGLEVQPITVTGAFEESDMDYLAIKGNKIYRIRIDMSDSHYSNETLLQILEYLEFI